MKKSTKKILAVGLIAYLLLSRNSNNTSGGGNDDTIYTPPFNPNTPVDHTDIIKDPRTPVKRFIRPSQVIMIQ